MYGIISNLEKRGLVERKSEASHERILRTQLTLVGAQLVRRAHKIIQKIEANMTSSLSDEKKFLLEKLLLECFSNMNAGCIQN